MERDEELVERKRSERDIDRQREGEGEKSVCVCVCVCEGVISHRHTDTHTQFDKHCKQ